MKKILSFILMLLFSSTIYNSFACVSNPGDPPLPGINAPTKGCSRTSIDFQPPYVGIQDVISHYMDWGDGSKDTLTPNGQFPNFSHTYSDSGTYLITLIKINGNTSAKDSSTQYIKIYKSPTAKYIYDSTNCAQSLVFTDKSTSTQPLSNWLWYFGDSLGFSSAQDTSFLYPQSGNYDVKLLVTDTSGCQDDTTITIAVMDTNKVNFTITENCPCNSITFNGIGSSTTYNWDFGDGQMTTGASATNLYKLPGVYDIVLNSTDIGGCNYKTIKKITVCGTDIISAPNANNTWYFGRSGVPNVPADIGAGLDFNGGSPIAKTDGEQKTLISPGNSEGCASVCNPKTGALLFYTNGENVWDKNHNPMPNGNTLPAKAWSANQNALILPYPEDTNKYYIFLNGPRESPQSAYSGKHYAVVDMTANGGLGDVISTALIVTETSGIAGNATEALTGTKMIRCDKKEGYWAVFPHQNSIYAVPVTDTGVGVPVISTANAIYDFTIGGSAISPDGRIYVVGAGTAPNTGNRMEFFKFDPETGIATSFDMAPRGGYGVAFSEDGTKLYTIPGNYIAQYDMTANDISASFRIVYQVPSGTTSPMSGIFRGPDNKIYVAQKNRRFLSVINNPNNYGTDANFTLNSIDLLGKLSGDGLQNLVEPNYLKDLEVITANMQIDTPTCATNTITITNLTNTITPPLDLCSFYVNDTLQYAWNFGDAQTSTKKDPGTHTYTNPGNYNIELIVTRPFTCFADTIVQSIQIDTVPILSFTSDSACLGDTTHFTSSVTNVINPPITYYWSSPVNDTTANPSIIFPITGNTNVIMTITDSSGCSYSDTNLVIIHDIPLAIDSIYTICFGNSFTMQGGIGTNYTWSPNVFLSDSTLNNPTANPDSSGTYQVIVSSLFCGADTGQHSFIVNPLPIIQTINDTTLDLGNSIILNASGANNYIWSPLTFLDNGTVNNPKASPVVDITYIVSGTDSNNCVNTDTVVINININDEYYVPIAFTPNGDGDNDNFLVRGLQGEKDFLLKVFDRWGNKVFESTDKNDVWNGTYKGQTLRTGVFVYVIDVTLINEQVLPRKKGNITLIK